MATGKARGQFVEKALERLYSILEKVSETPSLDAQVLLASLLEKPRSWILAHPEAPLTGNNDAALEAMVARLEAGEPLPYILGAWEFFGLEFYITSEVLIPRPETEILVTRAIAWLSESHPGIKNGIVLDVGTGSGCIAISLAVNVPGVNITATDISAAALRVASRNAEKLGVANRVTFLEADLFPFSLLPRSYSLILANLPYIPTEILQNSSVYNREPTLALDGGSDGLALIRRLLAEASCRLIPGGLLLVEIESSEGQAVLSLASHAFPKARISLHKDLADHDRLVEVQA